MDSMTEMFCDESSEILRNMRKTLLGVKDSTSYEQEVVQELFRGVHTLKADSTMMLYESMSELSNVMESLLYCFRGGNKRVTEVERFNTLITGYLDFFEQEIDKLADGRKTDGTAEALEQEIKIFTSEIIAKMSEEEAEEYQKNISKPKRQIYYIASASDAEVPEVNEKKKKAALDRKAIEKVSPEMTVSETAVPAKKADSQNVEASKSKKNDAKRKESDESTKLRKKRYIISEAERQLVSQSVRNLLRIIDTLEYELGNDESGTFTRKQLERLQDVYADLELVKKELVNTDFVPVAKKMEIVVDEMSEQLHKPVKLLVKGQEIPVGSEQREKISSALIHIIRNAVDHGIEDSETRERLGKSPMGLIKLRFSTENGRLKVSVKDDGSGIDTEKVLKAAQEKNLLTKPAEEYSEREIYGLMLVSGVTTTEVANEYSGRGVGMDVISHNVSEMGGKLKISSKKGLGTTITMKF